jgi:hypothetical protein
MRQCVNFENNETIATMQPYCNRYANLEPTMRYLDSIKKIRMQERYKKKVLQNCQNISIIKYNFVFYYRLEKLLV